MLHVQRSPPVFPALDGGFRSARYQRMTSVIMGERRLFHPSDAFIIKHTQALNSLARRQALVVVNHDRNGVTDRFTHGTDDRNVFLHCGITDLGFYAREAALSPIFRDFRRPFDAVVAHCTVGWNWFLDTTKQPHERCPVAARRASHSAMSIAESAMPTRP